MIILIGIVAGGVYAYYSVVNQESSNTAASSTSSTTSAYYAPSVKIFKSTFFQFQTDRHWVESVNESNNNKYVYRSMNGNLIEHELTVYVNQIPGDLSANRVLPINIKPDRGLQPEKVSQHCAGSAGAPRIDKPLIVLDRVKFRCDSDSTNFTVLVGTVDSDSILRLSRPNGNTAQYTLYYTNLKAIPDTAELTEILESFQSR